MRRGEARAGGFLHYSQYIQAEREERTIFGAAAHSCVCVVWYISRIVRAGQGSSRTELH